MQTNVLTALAPICESGSRDEAVSCFLDLLEIHSEKIADVKKRVEQVYRFETPDRPVFQFDVKGLAYHESRWVRSDLDKLLDRNMQNLAFKLESMPESDFVPLLGAGLSGPWLIPSMFGVTFDFSPQHNAFQHFNLIEELPRDLSKLEDVDVTKTEAWTNLVERVRFMVEVTQGKVQIAYPQMQGQLTNASRFMDQEDMLIACYTDPESMRVIANTWADVASRLIMALQQVAGDPSLLRPRGRFYQPDWVCGLIVGDYLTIMDPEQYYRICSDSWEIMYRRLGHIFYHTCGPVLHSVDVMKKLPGLAGFECTYVRGQNGTIADLTETKRLLNSKIVLHSFEWPLGGAVEDTENLTAEWLSDMSRGGGFMMQDSGSIEKGRDLFEKLEII